jgi:uncharacterized protein YkwD
MRRRTVLILGTAGLAAWAVPAPFGGAAGGDLATALERLAEARRQEGLPALSAHAALRAMADDHAFHLQRLGAVTHYGPEGEDPMARGRRHGYSGRVLGEALAESRAGTLETVAGWLQDEVAREIVLDPHARHAGLAMRHGADGRIWWDLVTGA